jgi:outer membrane receptor protein involved in Fe transport
VYALYSEISFPVGKIFDAKLGGRYERTNIESYYSNAQSKVDIPGYNTFVPSVFLSKKIGDDQQIKLSYSKRIERPDFRDLDPFINTSDPKNITAGNPYLQPEIGNRFELGYNIDFNKIGSIMISGFYRTSNHDIQSYLVYYPSLKVGDSTYTNVSVSTRENVGLEKDLGINFFANVNMSSKFSVRTNVFAFKRHTLNAIDPGYDARSTNFRMNINMSYQFSNTLVAEFFGNFNSPRHEVQGRYPSFTSYSFAIRKQFWKKNGSLALTALNPFNEYVKQTTVLHGPDFVQTSFRKIPFRSIGLNFTWKFGKLEFKKDKEENNSNLNSPSE